MLKKIKQKILDHISSTILQWLFPKLFALIPPLLAFFVEKYYHVSNKAFYNQLSIILITILLSTILLLIPYIFTLRRRIKFKKLILPKGYVAFLNLIWDQDDNIICPICLVPLQASFLKDTITKEEDKSVYQCNECNHKTILKNDKGELITKDQAKKLKNKFLRTYKKESNIKIWLSFILILLIVLLVFYLSIYKLCISTSQS